MSALFNVLTGFSNYFNWKKIFAAPATLRNEFIKLINNEKKKAQQNMPAMITAKMNSLSDPEIISSLYDAAKSGVKINLIVRGICCLKPGIAGLSENINVYSIVGRFLEHHRIFIFGVGAAAEVYLSSADWMPRNFDRRIEIAFPIEDKSIKQETSNSIETMLSDTVKLRTLLPDGTYTRVTSDKFSQLNSQEKFFEKLREDYISKQINQLDRRFKGV